MTKSYQLRISLVGIEPAIWRRVHVPGNLNLERLHRVVQDAMGWEDAHLHSFEVAGVTYGPPDDDGYREIKSEKQHTLERLVRAGDSFEYVYDFGDNWRHEIAVEQVTDEEASTLRCVDGQRTCPPEDCGGIWEYGELVAAFVDESHPRREELLEWAPEGWTPEDFDRARADMLVARHRPEPGRPRGAKSGKKPRAGRA